jgi:hypothetical protein
VLDSAIVQGNKIICTSGDVKQVYDEIVKYVLTGNIPVYKAIGLQCGKGIDLNQLCVRNEKCVEMYPEIMASVQDMLFFGNISRNKVRTEKKEGPVEVESSLFLSGPDTNEIKVLNTRNHIISVTGHVKLIFYVIQSTGFYSVQDSFLAMNKNKYFLPLNTSFYLTRYVKILPLTGDVIEVRYKNGMTASLFEDLIRKVGNNANKV